MANKTADEGISQQINSLSVHLDPIYAATRGLVKQHLAYVEKLHKTDKSKQLRFTEQQLREIKDEILIAGVLSGKDPSDVDDAKRLSQIATCLEQVVEAYQLRAAAGRESWDDSVAELQAKAKGIRDQQARARVRRSLRVNDGRGRPRDPTIMRLVERLSEIYADAGGKVTKGVKGSFANFLRVLFDVLPTHLKGARGPDWFAGYAKKSSWVMPSQSARNPRPPA